MWRAVDQDGVVLDVVVTSCRDAKAATRFFRKLLRGLRSVPVLVIDKLASYGVAHRRLIRGVEHRRSKYLNNRAENSHQPTRQRERARKKFTSPGNRKKSTWWFGWFPGGRSAVSQSRGGRPRTSRQAGHGPRSQRAYQINEHQPRKEHVNFLRLPGHAQRFLSAFSGISPHFRPRRHRLTATQYHPILTQDCPGNPHQQTT
ncbi:MAG: DDE-type integrase/transposase/recombinase [Pseudonocardiaceae bacterium]